MKQILFFTNQLRLFAGKKLYANIIGMTLVSFLEGIGIFLLIPLLSLIGIFDLKASNIKFPWSNQFLPHHINSSYGLLIILVIYFLLMVGQNLFQRQQNILNMKIQQGFLRYLKEKTYKDLIFSNWDFFLKKRRSDITNILTLEVNRVGAGVFLFLTAISSLIFTLIQVALAFVISFKMTFFVLLFGCLLLLFSKTYIKKSHTLGRSTVTYSEEYLAGVTDHFSGIKDIKSNSLELSHIEWFTSICQKVEKNMVDLVRLRSISQLLYKVASSFLIVCFVYLAIKFFSAQPAQLMLIIVIFSRLWPRFTTIQSNLEQISALLPSFQKIIDLQNECIEAREINMNLENSGTTKQLIIHNTIECVNVEFRYNTKESIYALQNINLYIPANHMTAVVGKSGAGKSTLIDLLMGLNRPEKGQILIDGVPLSDKNLLSLRQSLSYVPQEPFLFNTSIRENMMIVKSDATEEELWEALEFASAADFVQKLPDGLDTVIGDRGIKLSGGERQRVVLARAILRKPAILILDEATSALDTENELKIQHALERLKGSMTIIVIAHRLSTIRNADQVVVLDNGRIIQNGGFRQLARESSGMFSHLLGQQTEFIH